MDSQLLSILISVFLGSGGVFMVLAAKNKEQANTLKLIAESYEKLANETKEKLDRLPELEKELIETKKKLEELQSKCIRCSIKK